MAALVLLPPDCLSLPENVTGSKTANVDKVSGKLATECTPQAAVQSVTSSEMRAEVPPSDPQFKRWDPPIQALARSLGFAAGGSVPTETDDVHRCSDVKPTVELSTKGNNPLAITAKVTSGTHLANNLTVYLNDQIISTQGINGSTTYTFDYTIPNAGSYTIRAVVTDSALYSGSDEKTVTVSGPGGPGGGDFPAD